MHSCAFYLQRLLRTIVGDQLFEQAKKTLDSTISSTSEREDTEKSGVLEEALQERLANKIEQELNQLRD